MDALLVEIEALTRDKLRLAAQLEAALEELALTRAAEEAARESERAAIAKAVELEKLADSVFAWLARRPGVLAVYEGEDVHGLWHDGVYFAPPTPPPVEVVPSESRAQSVEAQTDAPPAEAKVQEQSEEYSYSFSGEGEYSTDQSNSEAKQAQAEADAAPAVQATEHAAAQGIIGAEPLSRPTSQEATDATLQVEQDMFLQFSSSSDPVDFPPIQPVQEEKKDPLPELLTSRPVSGWTEVELHGYPKFWYHKRTCSSTWVQPHEDDIPVVSSDMYFTKAVESWLFFPFHRDIGIALGCLMAQYRWYRAAANVFGHLIALQPFEPRWKLIVASSIRRAGDTLAARRLYRQIEASHGQLDECARFIKLLTSQLGIC